MSKRTFDKKEENGDGRRPLARFGLRLEIWNGNGRSKWLVVALLVGGSLVLSGSVLLKIIEVFSK